MTRPRVGRRRLSAIPVERDTAHSRSKVSVVPAQRLLEVASALSDGATKLHSQLRHLEPSERDALLDLVADQVTVILTLWADLVRGVVSSDETETHTGDVSHRPARMRTEAGRTESGAADLHDGDEFDDEEVTRHPARVPTMSPTLSPSLSSAASPAAPSAHRGRPADGPAEADRLAQRRAHRGAQPPRRVLGARPRDGPLPARGERFVLGYLNVDGMKAVNDSHGPRTGDELLRKVTAALRATLRSYDVIMRLGGDEFLFSLPGADMATADLRFKEFAVILAEEAPGSSASVGFAELQEHDTLDDLVAGAETHMLKGRRTRRRGRG